MYYTQRNTLTIFTISLIIDSQSHSCLAASIELTILANWPAKQFYKPSCYDRCLNYLLSLVWHKAENVGRPVWIELTLVLIVCWLPG